MEDLDLEDGEIPIRPHQREPEPPQGSQTSKRSASAEADDLCAKTTLTKKYKLENNGTRSTTKRVRCGTYCAVSGRGLKGHHDVAANTLASDTKGSCRRGKIQQHGFGHRRCECSILFHCWKIVSCVCCFETDDSLMKSAVGLTSQSLISHIGNGHAEASVSH